MKVALFDVRVTVGDDQSIEFNFDDAYIGERDDETGETIFSDEPIPFGYGVLHRLVTDPLRDFTTVEMLQNIIDHIKSLEQK